QDGRIRQRNNRADIGSWSPDGFHIAATRVTSEYPTGELITIDTRNGHESLVTIFDVPFQAAWSPRGDLIAFHTQHDRIYVIHPDGSGLRQVTFPGLQCSDYGVAWAPDGTQLVFVRDCVDGAGTTEPATSGVYTGRL